MEVRTLNLKKIVDSKWFVVACTVVLLIFCLIAVKGIVDKGNVKTVNEETVSNILKDIYTPKNVDYYRDRRKYYIDNNILTDNEANVLFKTVDKLSKDDLERKIDIVKIDHSSPNNNSYGDNLYKVVFSVQYMGKTSNLEVMFFVNKDGSIYNHDVVEVN